MTGSARMKGDMNFMMFGGASTSCGLGSGTFARPLSLVLNGRSSFRHPSPVLEDAFSTAHNLIMVDDLKDIVVAAQTGQHDVRMEDWRTTGTRISPQSGEM